MSMFSKQPWHNNRSPNPFKWEPILFFLFWLLVILPLAYWVVSSTFS